SSRVNSATGSSCSGSSATASAATSSAVSPPSVGSSAKLEVSSVTSASSSSTAPVAASTSLCSWDSGTVTHSLSLLAGPPRCYRPEGRPPYPRCPAGREQQRDAWLHRATLGARGANYRASRNRP